jgi:hypothetical protein
MLPDFRVWEDQRAFGIRYTDANTLGLLGDYTCVLEPNVQELAQGRVLPFLPSFNIETTQFNIGEGPFEVSLTPVVSGISSSVSQNIYYKIGNSQTAGVVNVNIGETATLDDEHSHIHLDDFWTGRIYKIMDPTDLTQDVLLDEVDKNGFCINDYGGCVYSAGKHSGKADYTNILQDPNINTQDDICDLPGNYFTNFGLGTPNPNGDEALYSNAICFDGFGVGGLAPGFIDSYAAGYRNQYFPAALFCDGTYRLELMINPNGKYIEKDCSNNSYKSDPIVLDHSLQQDIIINAGQDISWVCMDDQYFRSNIIIKKGGSLYIENSKMFFDQDHGIIVEEGGYFRAEGCVFGAVPVTPYNTDCIKGYWKGIWVKGNDHQANTGNTVQYDEIGEIFLEDNIIENALCGLASQNEWLPATPSQTKSITKLYINSCDFFNNARSIVLSGHTTHIYGTEPYIIGNHFKNDVPFRLNNFVYTNTETSHFKQIHLDGKHTTEWWTNNVFENGLTYHTGTGIFATNSVLRLGGTMTGNELAADFTKQNEFKNLMVGVESNNMLGLTSTSDIYGNIFNDVRYGVKLNGNFASEVIDNSFSFSNVLFNPALPQSTIVTPQLYGIHNLSSEGVLIGGNSMNVEPGTTHWVYGVINRSTSSIGDQNEVFDNLFTGQFRAALQFEQGNTNMRLACNQFNGYDKYDVAITSGDLNDQGDCDPDNAQPLIETWHSATAPVGYNALNFLHLHINSNNANSVTFTVPTDNAAYIPTIYTHYTPEKIEIVPCEEDYFDDCEWRTKLPIETIWNSFNTISGSCPWNGPVPGPIKPKKLVRELAKTSMRSGNYMTAQQNLNSLNCDLGRRIMIPSLISEKKGTEAMTKLGELDLNDTENINFYNTYTALAEELIEDGEGKQEAAKAFLYELADAQENMYSGIGQTLKSINENVFYERLPEDEDVIEEISDPMNEISSTIVVSPNPTSHFIRIGWIDNFHNASFTKLEIMSIEGKIIDQFDINSSATVDVSHLESGIYLLSVYDSIGNTHSAKLCIK